MEIGMGLKKTCIEKIQTNSNIGKINKEKIINKFIEKFPKVKLETIIKINKYCDKINFNLENENQDQMDLSIYLFSQ